MSGGSPSRSLRSRPVHLVERAQCGQRVLRAEGRGRNAHSGTPHGRSQGHLFWHTWPPSERRPSDDHGTGFPAPAEQGLPRFRVGQKPVESVSRPDGGRGGEPGGVRGGGGWRRGAGGRVVASLSVVAATTGPMTTSHPPQAPALSPNSRFPRLARTRRGAVRPRWREAAAGGAAGGPGSRGCPDWTVRDLVAHVGQVQRFWGGHGRGGAGRPAAVGRGWSAKPSRWATCLAWSSASTDVLLNAPGATPVLNAAAGTWWGGVGESGDGGLGRPAPGPGGGGPRPGRAGGGWCGAGPLPPAPLAVGRGGRVPACRLRLDGRLAATRRPGFALVSDEGPSWTLILDATGASAVRGGPGRGAAAPARTFAGSGPAICCWRCTGGAPWGRRHPAGDRGTRRWCGSWWSGRRWADPVPSLTEG